MNRTFLLWQEADISKVAGHPGLFMNAVARRLRPTPAGASRA